MNSSPHMLKHCFVAIICSIVIAPSAFAQSEFIEDGQSAIGGSVGYSNTKISSGRHDQSVLSTGMSVSFKARYEVAVAYAKNNSEGTSAGGIAAGIVTSKYADGTTLGFYGFLAMGKSSAFGLGAALSAIYSASSSFHIVPSVNLTILRLAQARENRLGYGIATSFGFGNRSKVLFVITPTVSKITREQTVFGISLGIMGVIDSPSRK